MYPKHTMFLMERAINVREDEDDRDEREIARQFVREELHTPAAVEFRVQEEWQ